MLLYSTSYNKAETSNHCYLGPLLAVVFEVVEVIGISPKCTNQTAYGGAANHVHGNSSVHHGLNDTDVGKASIIVVDVVIIMSMSTRGNSRSRRSINIIIIIVWGKLF